MFLIRILILALASLTLTGCSFPLSPLLILMLVETPVQIEEDNKTLPNEQIIESEFEGELVAQR